MNYGVTRQSNLKWVATISDDAGKVVDTSQPFEDRVDARNLRDAARSKELATFAEKPKPDPDPEADLLAASQPAPAQPAAAAPAVPETVAEPAKPKRKRAPAKPKGGARGLMASAVAAFADKKPAKRKPAARTRKGKTK